MVGGEFENNNKEANQEGLKKTDKQKDFVEIQKYTPEQQEQIKSIKSNIPEVNDDVIFGLLKKKEEIGKDISEEEYNNKIINFFSEITQNGKDNKIKNLYNNNDEATIKAAQEDFTTTIKNEIKKEKIKEKKEKIEERIEETDQTIKQENIKDKQTAEQKEKFEKGISVLEQNFNKLTVTKNKVNWFLGGKTDKLKKEDLDWFKERDKIFNTEILAKDKNLKNLTTKDQLRFKKAWLANERIKNLGKTDQYADQKALQDSFNAFEKDIGYNFDYKKISELGYEKGTSNEKGMLADEQGKNNETKKVNSFEDLKDNPGAITQEQGENLLPSSETENIFSKEDINNSNIRSLENAQRIVKLKIYNKLINTDNDLIPEENKKEEYFKETGELDRSKTSEIKGPEIINELEKISKDAREETMNELSGKIMTDLNKYTHNSIVQADVNQIGKYFGKDNLGSSIKLETIVFEEQRMKMSMKVPLSNQQEYPAKIRHNIDGKLFINNPIDFSEPGICKLGMNNGKERELPVISPSIETMKGKIKELSPGEILETYKPKNMEEFGKILESEMNKKLESSFTYSSTNQLYVQREIEKNNMIQKSTNNVVSMLSLDGTNSKKILDINNPDIIDKEGFITEDDPKYGFLKLLSDSGNNYSSTSEMKECGVQIETLAHNIKNKILNETSTEPKYVGDETLTKYIFNKENFANNDISPIVEFLNIFTKEIPGEKKKENNTRILDIQALKCINKAFEKNEKIVESLQKGGSNIYIKPYNDLITEKTKTQNEDDINQKLSNLYDKVESIKPKEFPPHLIG